MSFSKPVVKDPNVLLSAAESGDLGEVKRLLDEGWDVEGCDSDGWRALHLAACNGRTDVVRFLIGRGAEVDARDHLGMTALMLADEDDVIKLLVEREAGFNFTDDMGKAAIHWLADRGNTRTVELLVKLGADVDVAEDDTGDTALHRAACGRHTQTVFVLLENLADVFRANNEGKQVVQCVSAGLDYERTTKLLQLTQRHFDLIVTGALHRCITEDPTAVHSYLRERGVVVSPDGSRMTYAELLKKLKGDKFTVAGFAKEIKDGCAHMEADIFRESYASYIKSIYEAVTTGPDDLDVSEVGDQLVSKWDVPVHVPRPPPRPPANAVAVSIPSQHS